MAQKLSDSDAPKEGNNSVARIDAHRKLRSQSVPIEAKITKLKDDLKSIRKQWSADHGFTLADFDAARRLADIEDDDERKSKVSAQMEIYNALQAGEQMAMNLSEHYEDDPV